METEIDCKKEKELFFSYLGSLGLGVLLLLLIAFLYFYNNYKKEKIYEAFVNNQELICKNNIVSFITLFFFLRFIFFTIWF